jgi:ribA/ribD-fused uncharacterized protein
MNIQQLRTHDNFVKYCRLQINQGANVLPFYGHTEPSSTAFMSQFYPCEFMWRNHVFYSAEQFMMFQKARLFKDEKTMNLILTCNSALEAKTLGRQVRNFDEKVWKNKRESIVLNANMLKFKGKLAEKLNATGKDVLVEAAKYDKIWGVGLHAADSKVHEPEQWKGLNLLGKQLMLVRYYNNQK